MIQFQCVPPQCWFRFIFSAINWVRARRTSAVQNVCAGREEKTAKRRAKERREGDGAGGGGGESKAVKYISFAAIVRNA